MHFQQRTKTRRRKRRRRWRRQQRLRRTTRSEKERRKADGEMCLRRGGLRLCTLQKSKRGIPDKSQQLPPKGHRQNWRRKCRIYAKRRSGKKKKASLLSPAVCAAATANTNCLPRRQTRRSKSRQWKFQHHPNEDSDCSWRKQSPDHRSTVLWKAPLSPRRQGSDK